VEGHAGGIYIIKLSSPTGQSRNVVYGRDFFLEDKFFVKVEEKVFNDFFRPRTHNNTPLYPQKLEDKYRSFLGFSPENQTK